MSYRFAIQPDDNDPVWWIITDLLRAVKKRVPYVLVGLVIGLVAGYAWCMAQTGGHF
jgi:hypothetical protein